MKDMALTCNVGFLPSHLTKGRARRMSQLCPSQAERGSDRDSAKALAKSK